MIKGTLRFGPLQFMLLLALLLSGYLAWMWVDEHAHLRNLNWAPPKALPPDIKAPTSPQKNTAASNPALYAVLMERPVFAPDRRPPPPPAPPPPPDPLADIQISGIFSGANAGILARIGGKLRRVKVNEDVGSWTLKSIDGRDITFTQGTNNRQLRLAYARLNTPIQTPVAVANKAPGSPAPTGAPLDPRDEARERLRVRNEARAARGFPPIVE